MQGNSRPVVSSQTGVHPKLDYRLSSFPSIDSRRPVADWSRAAFQRLQFEAAAFQGPLLFDSCCGTGESSLLLAKQYPDHLVVGIDKSIHRLQRGRQLEQLPNCLLLHANVVDIWQVAVSAKMQLARHYLLYPNPWPKLKHLHKRWYAQPALHFIVALGGTILVRSNWRPYLEDFRAALQRMTNESLYIAEVSDAAPLSPFERKYRTSRHRLYELRYGNSISTT